MNKNLIKGRRDGVSWHNTANSTGEVVEVNQAVVRGRTASLPGEVSGVRAPEKSAEVNAHQAVRQVEAGWKRKRRHAVDCDLKAFFDTVNHDRLLTRLREKIGGGKLLRLIGRYLRAGVELPDGSREATPLDVPQGGPLSPLLANIVLGHGKCPN